MKISHYLLAGLAIFGLAACSSDDDISGGENPGIETGTYMSVSFTDPSYPAASRTEGLEGDNSDNGIENVSIVLAKNYQIVKTVSAPVKTNANGQFQSAPIEVSVGSYQVFAFVNPSDGVLTYIQQTGVPVRGVIDLAEKTAETYAKSGSFAMMSQNNKVGGHGEFYVTITTDNTIGNPAPVTDTPNGTVKKSIPVQRFVAKLKNTTETINIDGVKDIKDNNGDPLFKSATISGFVEINGIKKSNTIQDWKEYTGVASPEGKLLSIPAVTSGVEFYNQLDDIQAEAMKGNLPTFKAGPIHVLENRPDEAQMGNTTGVIFSAKFELNKDATSFYYLEGLLNGQPYAAYFTNLDELKLKYKEVTGEDWDDELLNDPNLAKENGLSIYNGNVAYYTYWVDDMNYKVEVDNGVNKVLERYPVVHRNTIYNLTVKNIFNVGPSIPGGPDPIDPTDPIKKPTYMEVDISVQPWIISNNDIDL